MNALTCIDVQAQIELYAAGECDAETAAAVARHVDGCDDCQAAHAEAARLVQLLDVRHQEKAGLGRLASALRQENRRRLMVPWVQRAMAVAAILLLVVGPLSWLLALRSTVLPTGAAGPDLAFLWQDRDAERTMRASQNGRAVEIELPSGEIMAQLPAADKRREPVDVTIRTPAGTLTASPGSEWSVQVGRGSAGALSKGDADAQVLVTVRRGHVRLSNAHGSLTATTGEALWAVPERGPTKSVEDLGLRFARNYQLVWTRAKPQIPAVRFPLDLKDVANHDAVAVKLKLPRAAVEPLLQQNGFVVLPGRDRDDLGDVYTRLQELDIPILITADTVLHLYRLQFDETLRDLEERVLSPDLTALTEALIRELERLPLPEDNARWRKARQHALTYLAVGLLALRPDAALPDHADAAVVRSVVVHLQAGKGSGELPLFAIPEDFSHYKPQGHYVHTDRLRRYCIAMTWFGRMSFFLRGNATGEKAPRFIVSQDVAVDHTLAASLLTRALSEAQLADKRSARAVWERIYGVTSFFVGLAADLGLPQYHSALARVATPGLDLAKLSEPAALRSLERELAKHQPAALATLRDGAAALSPQQLVDRLDETAGFRLFGQRFTPDTYLLSKLVYPNVGKALQPGRFTAVQTRDGKEVRGLPRGLDLMALLKSQRATELLRELGDDAYGAAGTALSYAEAQSRLERELAVLDRADRQRNLYWAWLYTLQPLLEEYTSGYQPFMTTRAYQDRALTAALASWTQLRHDTRLYAQPSGTRTLAKANLELMATKLAPDPAPSRRPDPPGYVEPLPELYGRLLALTRMTRHGLDDWKLLDTAGRQRLNGLESLLTQLLRLTEKQLANQPLSDVERSWISGFVGALRQLVAPRPMGKMAELEKALQSAALVKDEKRVDRLKRELLAAEYGGTATRLIADIHADPLSGHVLQAAVGDLDLGLFLWLQPNGRFTVVAGPVLSFYELKRMHAERFVGVQWDEWLDGTAEPSRPEWSRSYLLPAPRSRWPR